MDLANPLFDPPTNYVWELERGVNIYTMVPGTTPSLINLPPWTDGGGSYHPNFDGLTVYDTGSNYALAGAATYELGRWIYAQVEVYSDDVLIGLMAVEPEVMASASVVNATAIRFYSAPPPVWPETIRITYRSHSHPGDSGSIKVRLMKWVGDIWAAMPVNSSFDQLQGPTPSEDSGNNDCPPPCGTISSGLTPPTLDPTNTTGAPGAATASELRSSLEIGWTRTNGRIAPDLVVLGTVVGLRYGYEWDDEITMMLDGYHLVATALPAGGYTRQVEYRFRKIPLTDVTGATSLYFQVDTTAVDDPDHPVL